MHRWTGRVLLPVFTLVQLFLAGPRLYAEPPGITVTGMPVPDTAAGGTNVITAIPGADTNLFGSVAGIGTNATITLNFEGTDIRTVLLYLSEITGETILVDPKVRGEVSIINPKPVTPEEAKQIIFSILETMPATIVKYDHLIKVIPSGDAKTRPIKTMGPKPVEAMDTEDILRAQVVYPKHVTPKDVEMFITPLMTVGAGKCIVNEPTGAVILIDTGPNIKRLMEIIDLIDKVIEGGEVDIQIVKLEYADEKELATLLTQIFSAPALKAPGAQKVTLSGGGEGAKAPAPGAPAVPSPPSGTTPTPSSPAAGTSSTELDLRLKADCSFIAESRMHALIVISTKRFFPMIMEMVRRLDVPNTEKDDVIHIYPLQHAEAEEIANTLNNIFSSGERTTQTTTKPDTRAEETSRTPTASRPGVTIPRSQPPTSSYERERERPSTPTTTSRAGSSYTHLSGKVDVIPHKESNALIVITSPRYYEAVRRIIEKLDERVPQVWIEAIIVEVSRDKNYNLGVGWKDILDHRGSDVSLIQALDTAIGPALDDKGKIPRDNIPGVAYAFGTRDKYGNFDPYFTLQTAEGIVDVNVLSTPSILASNNKDAEITVGKTVPYQNYSTGTDTASVRDYSYSYLEIMVILSIKPIINKYGEVMMETDVDVNEDGGKSNPDDPNAPPITLKRKARTSVVVQDGQTLVIGGLIKDDFKTTVNKVPVLGDIPIVKHAFRTKYDVKSKTELLIFITPHVVVDWGEGTELTTNMRNRFRGANAFVENRDRSQLYDDLNTERSDLTIYDDWREFEKNVKETEHYYMMEKGRDTGTEPAKPIYYFGPGRERKPFEGEIPDDKNTPDSPGGSIEPVGSTDKRGSDNQPLQHVSALLSREQALLRK